MAEAARVLPDTTYPCDNYSRYRLIDLFKELRCSWSSVMRSSIG